MGLRRVAAYCIVHIHMVFLRSQSVWKVFWRSMIVSTMTTGPVGPHWKFLPCLGFARELVGWSLACLALNSSLIFTDMMQVTHGGCFCMVDVFTMTRDRCTPKFVKLGIVRFVNLKFSSSKSKQLASINFY
jgi:hypothetical protein